VQRDIIHPECPFTADEVAAAWIVHGLSPDEAVRDGNSMKNSIREEFEAELEPDEDLGDGWIRASGRGGVSFLGGFDATLHLVADTHADGTMLSPESREAWLGRWPHDFDPDEVAEVLDRLATLGPSWAAKRAEFQKLLQHRGTPPKPYIV